MSLFISYTRSDVVPVRAVKDDLERMGRSVWLDHEIHGGERWWQEIIQQIQAAEVFIFALSNDSWQSRPCRAELEYAEQLRVPVIPVQVGPLDSRYIKIAERQIIDYRNRSADAVLALMLAVTDLAAAPRQWPSPLPEPPSVPFEYLHRIANRIDVHSILPEAQGQIIDELRRKLNEENDDLARSDILRLLRQLRDRQELTVPHAAEIDSILQGAEAKAIHPPTDGATRLPPAHHWRQGQEQAATGPGRTAAQTSPQPPASTPKSQAASSRQQGPAHAAGSAASEPAERPSSPAPTKPPVRQAGSAAGEPVERPSPQAPTKPPVRQAGSAAGEPVERPSPQAPTKPPVWQAGLPEQPRSSQPRPSPNVTPPTASSSQGAIPPWLADIVGGTGTQRTGAGQGGGAAGAVSSTRGSAPESRYQDSRQWWSEAQEPRNPFLEERAGSPPSPSRPATSEGRFAFIGAALGAMGIPLSLLSLGDSSFDTVVATLLLLCVVLGLSMAVVAATRREPWARAAVVLGVLGLISAIIALVAGIQ